MVVTRNKKTRRSSVPSTPKVRPSPNASCSNISEDYLCPSCVKPVKEEKSLQCDGCGEYTHLTCDKTISTKLYDAIGECPANSLMYLCAQCKPSFKNFQESAVTNNRWDDIAKDQANGFAKMSKTITDQISKLDILSGKICGIEKSIGHNSKAISDLTTRQTMTNVEAANTPPGPMWSQVASGSREQFPSLPPTNSPHADLDLKNSLVIYGINRSYDPGPLVHQICADLCINKKWIVNVRSLRQSGPTSPIRVTCINSEVKWDLLVGINSLKIPNTYAKLYMTTEELQKDRALVKKVKELRMLHKDRVFKIKKGNVIEEFEDYTIIM